MYISRQYSHNLVPASPSRVIVINRVIPHKLQDLHVVLHVTMNKEHWNQGQNMPFDKWLLTVVVIGSQGLVFSLSPRFSATVCTAL